MTLTTLYTGKEYTLFSLGHKWIQKNGLMTNCLP